MCPSLGGMLLTSVSSLAYSFQARLCKRAAREKEREYIPYMFLFLFYISLSAGQHYWMVPG